MRVEPASPGHAADGLEGEAAAESPLLVGKIAFLQSGELDGGPGRGGLVPADVVVSRRVRGLDRPDDEVAGEMRRGSIAGPDTAAELQGSESDADIRRRADDGRRVVLGRQLPVDADGAVQLLPHPVPRSRLDLVDLVENRIVIGANVPDGKVRVVELMIRIEPRYDALVDGVSRQSGQVIELQ